MAQTLFRGALKGLKAVNLKVSLLADGCDGSFLPITRSALTQSVREVLESGGIAIDRAAPARLVVDVRARLLNITSSTGVLFKIESSLREPVTIARNGAQCEVDTWRHRSTSAVFHGLPSIPVARELVESEVLRQVDAFTEDAGLIGPEAAPPSTDGGSPAEPRPDAPSSGEKECHQVRLGELDGVPEFKTEMETQCVGPPWARVCTDMPVFYTRTSKVVAFAEICGPRLTLESAKKELEQCAVAAASAVTIAVIVAGPEAALPAFKATFAPCIEAKLKGLATQIDVKLKTDQESGQWRRRS